MARGGGSQLRLGVPPPAAGVIPAAAVRQFNPRFEESFSASRSYDPDRERAETRHLKRQLVKERRGARPAAGRALLWLLGTLCVRARGRVCARACALVQTCLCACVCVAV